MKNGIIIVLLLVIIAGGIYFIESNRKGYDLAIEQDVASSTETGTTDNSALIRQTVEQTKAMLPMKVDAKTTFTDVIGGKNSLTYVYEVDANFSQLRPEQRAMLRDNFSEVICPKTVPMICGVGKVFLDNGIVINTKYKEGKSDNLIVECRYSKADCDKLPRK